MRIRSRDGSLYAVIEADESKVLKSFSLRYIKMKATCYKLISIQIAPPQVSVVYRTALSTSSIENGDFTATYSYSATIFPPLVGTDAKEAVKRVMKIYFEMPESTITSAFLSRVYEEVMKILEKAEIE